MNRVLAHYFWELAGEDYLLDLPMPGVPRLGSVPEKNGLFLENVLIIRKTCHVVHRSIVVKHFGIPIPQ